MCESQRPLVIDNGSGTCKVGFAGDQSPRALFSSVVGRPRHQLGAGLDDCYVGDKAQAERGVLNLKYPIDCGIITDWDAMEKIWHHAFYNELGVSSEEQPLLLTEPPFNPKNNREKMTEILFERFSVPALSFAQTGVLSLFSCGEVSGVVLESGDGVSLVVPIYEGYSQLNTIQRVDLAGRDLTYYLMKVLSKRGHSLTTSSQREIVRDIKEKLCRVASDSEEVLASSSSAEESYQLPDGETITLGSERFQCPEVLFQPNLLNRDHVEAEYDSLPQAVHNSVSQFEDDLHNTLYSKIILCGGNTMFPGLKERMEKEINKVVPVGTLVKTMAHPVAQYSAWLGGSIIASVCTFQEMLTKKQEYDENGPSVVHKKCHISY